MLFNSLEFIIFLPAVLLIYFILPEKIRYIWLLISSYYFYMCWNAEYAVLIFVSTLVTYICGVMLERSGDGRDKPARYRKICLAISVTINLLILFFFKYFGFALGIAKGLLGFLHIELHINEFDILLPVGISFYIFQALGYTIDVYRGETKAEKNFLKYALFVSFFPQLVAGPIERSKNLLKQLFVPHAFSFERFLEGLYLMLWGYFLKLVIADRIAIYVDAVFDDIVTYRGCFLAVAVILFAVQIYCDFAGYSVIAKGAALCFGIELMDNFDAPYLSESVAEFWRRWHISLTSWFRDYLYIPLGGNRKGRFRQYLNIMIVFLLSGLWHGASFNYVAWGGINGLYQVIGTLTLNMRKKISGLLKLDRESMGFKISRMAGTFFLVDLSWIFFRAGGLKRAFVIIKSIFTADNPWVLFDGSLYNFSLDEKGFTVLCVAIFILLAADLFRRKKIRIRKILLGQDWLCQSFIVSFSVLAILLFGIWGEGYDAQSFIYFRF
ncbi:MAG: MBOAT family protein [Lachnospiraceae bacterium]|nr:MBOAT family protein [Lachnospiraceae bacterium]